MIYLIYLKPDFKNKLIKSLVWFFRSRNRTPNFSNVIYMLHWNMNECSDIFHRHQITCAVVSVSLFPWLVSDQAEQTKQNASLVDWWGQSSCYIVFSLEKKCWVSVLGRYSSSVTTFDIFHFKLCIN